jgi:hypothetical protein
MIMAVIVGAAGFFGYQGYEIYNEPQIKLAEVNDQLEAVRVDFAAARSELSAKQEEITTLNADLKLKSQEVDRLDTALRLLKVDRRLAELRVIDQQTSEEEGSVVTRVSFVETNAEGHPIGEPREFDIVGDMVYVDYLVAKFDDKYIEEADLERGTAICLFQRIFGENQQPSDGYMLDEVGTRPTAYARGGAISEFEQNIWNDFWTIANDPEKATEHGIRAAHGNAAAIRVQPGKSYQLELRATGEFSLRPLESTTP